MSSEEVGTLNLADPKAMRAMAHPVRMALMELLAVTPTLTATQASEALGESPANCAFHLRTLAKYGFTEEDPDSAADGRERPWRARMLAFSLNDVPGAPAATRVASRLLVENIRAAAEENRARYVTRQSEYPADWQAAAGETFSVAHVSPQELQQMREQVLEVMAPYIRVEPDSRPAGARPVRIMLDMFPWFGPGEDES